MKILNFFDERPSFFSWAFGLSLAIIPLGFGLFGIPGVEDFFNKYMWLFYLLFFGPLCLVIITFCMVSILAVKRVYAVMTSKGITPLKTVIYIGLGLMAIAIIFAFYIFSEVIW